MRQTKSKSPDELLRLLTGEEGPAWRLFIEFAGKYGIPIKTKSGKIPFSTELNVMLAKYRVFLLDPVKVKPVCAIGFHGGAPGVRVVSFAFWSYVPHGAFDGYIDIGDHSPLIEVFSGALTSDLYNTEYLLSTVLRFNDRDLACKALPRTKDIWSIFCEIIFRARELADECGDLVCKSGELRS